jgi:N-acetyl-gamma-glutamyl-phosphate reductase
LAVYKVFIDGSSGTCGLKIHEYLDVREDIEIVEIEDVRRRSVEARLDSIEEADITFLCLPDDAARDIVKSAPEKCRIIDTSTAHRTDDGWVYGMPELEHRQRQRIGESKRVANPGCHASGFIFLIRPLIEAGVMAPDCPLSATSLTGYSGGGRQMIAAYRTGDRKPWQNSPAYYGLDQAHKHIPEMMKMTGMTRQPTFMPVVGDFCEGMMVTVPLAPELLRKRRTVRELAEIYEEYYGNEPLIEVKTRDDQEKYLYSGEMAGRDGLEIIICGSDERPVLFARYDNLCKGAAGAAVQNMNIMLGIDETTGLRR